MTELTAEERRSLQCSCTRLDDEWHHERFCPVPAVEQILAKRVVTVEAIKRLHRPDEYEHESPEEPSVRIYCHECSNYGRRSFVTYPCPTLQLFLEAKDA